MPRGGEHVLRCVAIVDVDDKDARVDGRLSAHKVFTSNTSKDEAASMEVDVHREFLGLVLLFRAIGASFNSRAVACRDCVVGQVHMWYQKRHTSSISLLTLLVDGVLEGHRVGIEIEGQGWQRLFDC